VKAVWQPVSKVPAISSIIFLLLAVSGRWPYGFYTLLRLVVCVSAVYLVFQANELKKTAWIWLMGGTALLFNPLIPVRLGRSDWQVFDLMAAVVFGVSLAAIREPR